MDTKNPRCQPRALLAVGCVEHLQLKLTGKEERVNLRLV